MTGVLDPALADHLATYPYTVVSYIDKEGYPLNVATRFRVDAANGLLYLDPFDAPDQPDDAWELEVTFSHVRPQPGVGYDQRRYVNVWGTATRGADGLVLVPTRIAGWDERHVPFVEYCERNLNRAQDYMAKLSAERGEPVGVRMPLRWRLFLATRVPFLTATLVPVLLGALVARSQGHSAWWLTALTLLGAACIHLGLNVVNDLFDVASGADAENVTPTPFSGGSRVLLYGLASRRWMWTLAVTFFVTGATIGTYLAVTRTLGILWLGMAGVALSVFYSAPPLKLVYRGVGDIAVAAGFGPIMTLGSFAVVARGFTLEAFYASLPVALFTMLILYVNQIPDRKGDARAGKRTVAVRFGREWIVRGYDVFVAAGFLLVVIGALWGPMPRWTLLGLLAAPLALRIRRGLRAHYDSPYELIPALGANIALHLFMGLGLIAGYAIDIAITR